MESRRGALIDNQRDILIERIKKYLDPATNWDTYVSLSLPLSKDLARFDAKRNREIALAEESFNPANLRRYTVRPFDVRWCYYSQCGKLWNEY